MMLIPLWASPAYATESDTQLWAPITLDIPMGKKWFSTMEVQPRFADDISELSVIRFRPSVTYRLNNKTNATLGYFWSPDFQTHRNEHRIWQQLVRFGNFKKVTINHQVRLEERFIEGADTTAWRGRYLLRLMYPIQKDRWYWVISDEVLVNLNTTPQVAGGFNQNRLFTGLRRFIAKNSFIEGGYMLLFSNQDNRPDQLNHIMVIRLGVNIDDLNHDKHLPDEGPTPYWQTTPLSPL